MIQVLRELEQIRSGWTQSKQIIKQQRRTIKAQELQLQLALGCNTDIAPQPAQQQYLAAVKLKEVSSSHLSSLIGAGESSVESLGGLEGCNDAKYPITGYVLMQQQQHKRHVDRKAREMIREAAERDAIGVAAGKQGVDVDLELSLGSDRNGVYSADGLCASTDRILNGLTGFKQQQPGPRQQSSHRVGTMVRPPMTPSGSTGGLNGGHLL